MYSIINGIKIDAIAVGVPNRWFSLEEQFGNEDSGIDAKMLKKFMKNTGVEGRFVSTANQTNSDWCYAAAERILDEKQIDRNKIGVVIYVTQTADYREPATAMVLQHRLHIGTDCIAFDINLGCSGFVYGLNVVSSLMLSCNAQYGLLMCGETGGREKIPDEKPLAETEKMLFGDAGSAIILKKDAAADSMYFMSKSDGSGFRALIDPWGFYRNPIQKKKINNMDGVAVFNFSINEAPELINDLMWELNTTSEDYDYLVLHQANKLIMNQIEKKTGFPSEKSLKSISKYANTSSASIPTALVHNLAVSQKGKSHFLMCGFGIGLSWSAVDCYIQEKDIFPLVETDEYFDDGYQTEWQIQSEKKGE